MPTAGRALLLALAVAGALAAMAQELEAPAAAEAARPSAAAIDAPVPVPELSEKALRYYRSGNRLWIAWTLLGLAIPALFLWSGGAARLQRTAERIAPGWVGAVLLFFAAYTLLVALVELPLSYYTSFVRPHAYGLSNQTLAKWTTDAAKGLGVALVAGALVIWMPYALLRRSPRRWWLWSGLAAAPVLAFFLLVAPVWVDPLFNEFGPMRDQALEESILALATRAGIEGGRVYEVAKSVDTEKVNAYVTGLFGTQRIVLWNTLLRKLEPPEVLAVMGHEIGHYVLRHVLYGLAGSTLLVFAALFAVDRVGRSLLVRFGRRLGFARLEEPASLPLFVLLFSLVSLALSPVALAVSRHLEHEADRLALELTRDNRALATAFVALQEENLSNPRPGWLFKLWRSSHPPLAERIEFANAYRPWEEGKRLRYGDALRPAGVP